MPRSVPQSDLDAIREAVARFSEGASIEDIGRALSIDLPRRTLQRRLALLTERGQLISEGAGRGCRYRLPPAGAKGAHSAQPALKRGEVIRRLAQLKPQLASRFGVTRVALFGSTARDRARPDSDIDIIVAFDGPATSERYFGVQFMLEDELGRPVDLVTDKAMRAELRPYIEREALDV